MSLLVELVVDILAGGLGGPPSDRGLVIFFTVAGSALALASAWLTAIGINVVHAPGWQIGILLASLFAGSAGSLVAALHVRRQPAERFLAGACLVFNMVAVSISIAGLVR